jgi:DNA invertase Pin-like site-specific DNA recombinase
MAFSAKPLIPAAQYVRMSDAQQVYSIENQTVAIQEYAAAHGFAIVKTYADSDRSGIEAKRRAALQALLKDVISGDAKYQAILVYDVSRWGRFPNNDEAAYYEFLCQSSGIPLHYCAEPFLNDGTATSSLLKALKRNMAAEFSRELGEKVFRGKARIVQKGYWVGGPPGYGLRRLMIAANGQPKQVLKPGEQKSLTTDRVVLIPGPFEELKAVRLIFRIAATGKAGSLIARELNRRGISCCGKPWLRAHVDSILRNPKYMGCNTWGRSKQRLRGPKTWVERQHWVTKPHAFEPIIDEATFERAQAARPKIKKWTREIIVDKVRQFLRKNKRISADILKAQRGMPHEPTIIKYLGSYDQLYSEVGYQRDTEDIFMGNQRERSRLLRRKVVSRIRTLFPESVIVMHLPRRTRSVLLIDRGFMVSVLFCIPKVKHGKRYWKVEPIVTESEFITLLCRINDRHDQVLDMFVLPKMTDFTRTCPHDSWIRKAVPLRRLSDFYETVKQCWAERCEQELILSREMSRPKIANHLWDGEFVKTR